ncbi:hypothetical protein, partial [Frankia sp. R82]|uniref:hypothetical protein n=1 Tax=Frankia sp. R82 TaxID=2950553 RepID=UPI0020443428
TDPEPGGSDNPYDYAHQDPYNTYDLNGDRFHFKRPKVLSWKNAAWLGGWVSFGVCVVGSAGVCIGAGLAAAAVSATASNGRSGSKGAWAKSYVTNAAVNTAGGILGWRLGKTAMGSWGFKASKRSTRTLWDRFAGYSAHARRQAWGGWASQAQRGVACCQTTRSCPSRRP